MTLISKNKQKFSCILAWCTRTNLIGSSGSYVMRNNLFGSCRSSEHAWSSICNNWCV